ncbi:MAG TPA: amino acid-binding protein, partial [Deltaproteobacteria bacterium]|nr:amino acid-binding protein [Deltaproteobacteria bacterium]
QKDSVDYALIRLLVEDTDKAIDLLSKGDYTFDIMPVIALEIDNRPGSLAEMARKFGEEGINIDYVYGSALSGDSKSLFIFCPEDIDLAARIFTD